MLEHVSTRLPVLGILVLLLPSTLGAQSPPVLPANPQAPTLNPILPLGAKRGSKIDLTLTGSNLAGPTALWTSFPAKITIPTDAMNGKDNANLRVQLEIPADAPLGLHSLRLATTRGMSNFRPFCIDELPQLLESAGNQKRETAQKISLPCVLVGRLDGEASDYFSFTAKPGQRLSIEILGRRLGSTIDPQIQLYDAKTGRELPGGYSNDSPGLQTDCRLIYTFKTGGDYVVEVRDVTYRGGADFHYRLRVGEFPCVTTCYPLAVQRGTTAKIGFAGPLLDGLVPVEVKASADLALSEMWISGRTAQGVHAWPAPLMLSDLPETSEQEPNQEMAKATRVTMPTGISGRFLDKGDIDHYVLAVKKGQRVIVEAQTQELSSPTELYLTLRDAKGGQVAASNPAAPTRIDYTAPADGDYFLVAEHLHYWGGPEEVYHLTIQPYEPDFDLSVRLDRFDAPATGSFSTPIFLNRRDYGGPIEISVEGNPALSGKLTIPGGPAPQPNMPAGTLTVQVKGDAPMGPAIFTIQGRAAIGGKTVVRVASARAVVDQMLNNLAFPPQSFSRQLAVAIRQAPPFSFKVEPATIPLPVGGKTKIKVVVTRLSYQGPIAVEVRNLPANVTAPKATIAQGQSMVEIELMAAANAAPGKKADVVVAALATAAGNETINSPNLTVDVQKK